MLRKRGAYCEALKEFDQGSVACMTDVELSGNS
ncbi:hypothetical protein [Chlorobium sp.]